MAISLVLADDHRMLLDGLERLLTVDSGFSVLARCTNGDDTLRAVHELRPDVLILDLNLPGKNGFDVLRALRGQSFRPRVVMLSAAVTEEEVTAAIQLGVEGIVIKEMASDVLVRCIREVHAGGRWLDRDAVSRALESLLQREEGARRIEKLLSAREIDVLRLVSRGERNKAIARELGITEGTVKSHVHRLYEKTGVDTRVDLATWARRQGLG